MRPVDDGRGVGISRMSGPGGGPPPGYYPPPPQDPWYGPQAPADPYLAGRDPQDPWANAPPDPDATGYYGPPQDPYAPAPPGWYGQPPPGWQPPPPVPEKRGSGGTGAIVVGAFLVLLGIWFLFRDQVGIDLGRVWPAIAVALGALMVLVAFLPRRRSR